MVNKKINGLVDIIIPVHNRWEHTKQTLDSLIRNTHPGLYNLYVVDDNSYPENVEKLEEYWLGVPDRVNFDVYFQQENIGPGATRNACIKHITNKDIRSKYLYHSDNDVYFHPEWLPTLVNMYQELNEKSRDVIVLGGSCHPYQQNNTVLNFNKMRVGIKNAVSGYSQFMDYQTWDEFGPFDETMKEQEKKIMGSEDWAFCQKIIQAGFRVGSVEPEVITPTGKTNTYGDPATGSETFKDVEGVAVI